MNKPALKSVKKNERPPILIVDKIGAIGEALSQEFSKDYLVFFVSKRPLSRKYKNIALIPFRGRIPKIPENLYSKIFIVDDGENITRESVLSFVKKAKEIDAPLFFMGSVRNMDLKQADEIINKYSKFKVLIFGDIFDNKILFDKNTSITKFIIESRKNKKIKVPGVGLALNYPISFSDTIKLIIKATYINIPEKAILLFSKHPITDISLANTFQKIDPEIDVDFESEKKVNNIYIPKNSQYALEKYDLKKKLEEIDLGEGDDKNDFEIKRSHRIKFIKPISFFLIACVFLMFLPLISTLGYSKIAEMQLKKAVELAEEGKIEDSLKKSRNAERFYNLSAQTGDTLLFQTKFLNKDERASELLNRIEAGKDLSKASTHLLEGAVSIGRLNSTDALVSRKEIDSFISSFKNANIILQELKASQSFPKALEEKYVSIIPFIETISEISEMLPQILGFDKEKKYLILFTNENEIRSGGGVVELTGILSVKNGKITNFQLINNKEIDKQEASTAELPFAIRRYLDESSFAIRDSLSSPDFFTGAAVSASIYESVKNSDVDGIIALNTEIIENLILKNKSESVAINSNKISAENLNKSTLQEGDAYYEYIKSLTDEKENFSLSYLSLTEIIGKAILNKDILFVFKNGDIQNIFSAKNISGEIRDVRTEGEGINDYFGISESNLGNNKANYFVSRSVLREVGIVENGQLMSSVKISFKNNSEGEGAVEYRNYIKLILPQGSRIQSISDGGRSMALRPAITDPAIYERSDFVIPDELEIEETSEGNISVFGFLISVPPESAKNVTVEYLLPFRLSDERTKYSLIIYKQPGLAGYSYDQVFNLGEDYKVIPSNSFSAKITNDQEFIYFISEN